MVEGYSSTTLINLPAPKAIKSLTEILQATRSVSAPKRKFAFKKPDSQMSPEKAKESPHLSAESSPWQSTQPDATLQRFQILSVSDVEAQIPSPVNESVLSISSLWSSSYVLHESALKPKALITDIDHSFVDLSISEALSRPFSGLTIKDVSQSLLVCSRVSGATHITGAQDSTFIIWSQQLRMHECHSCVIYLRSGSRPIIEDCHGLRFAPLPDFIVNKLATKFGTH